MTQRQVLSPVIVLALAALLLCALPVTAAAATGWALQTSPNPTGGTFNQFAAVSCTSNSACTAVGYYDNASNVRVPLAERWNGTRWAVQTTHAPTAATSSELVAVSCGSSAVCIAVGWYTQGGTGDPVPFSEKWSGGSWGLLPTPVPHGSPDTELLAVGCSSATSCTAVGDSEAPDGHNGFFVRPLAERLGSSGWTIQSTAAISGVGAFDGVSCVSVTACVAVGYQSAVEGGADSTLVGRWNGAWSKQSSANPQGANNSVLSGVSCTANGSCAAVGRYVTGSGTFVAFAEGSSASSWTVQTTPVPGGTTFSQLLGVSCPASGSCEAVGDYRASSGETVTLAEVSASGKWTRQTTPNRGGATTDELTGIACTSGTFCAAVGYNNDSKVAEATLALRFT